MKIEELVIKDIKKALDLEATGTNKESIIALIESIIKAYNVAKDGERR